MMRYSINLQKKKKKSKIKIKFQKKKKFEQHPLVEKSPTATDMFINLCIYYYLKVDNFKSILL